MKTSRKLAAALAVFAAGSVFFGSLPAQAKGIESDGASISASRHHGRRMPPPEFRRYRGHMPPPPEFHRHHGHMPPPPEFHRHHGHIPPPPEHHHHRR